MSSFTSELNMHIQWLVVCRLVNDGRTSATMWLIYLRTLVRKRQVRLILSFTHATYCDKLQELACKETCFCFWLKLNRIERWVSKAKLLSSPLWDTIVVGFVIVHVKFIGLQQKGFGIFACLFCSIPPSI